METSILEFASTQRWRERLVLEKPRMTMQNYLWALQVFCEWAKKNPDELMLERQRERSVELEDSETVSFKRIWSTSWRIGRKRSTVKHSSLRH